MVSFHPILQRNFPPLENPIQIKYFFSHPISQPLSHLLNKIRIFKKQHQINSIRKWENNRFFVFFSFNVIIVVVVTAFSGWRSSCCKLLYFGASCSSLFLSVNMTHNVSHCHQLPFCICFPKRDFLFLRRKNRIG